MPYFGESAASVFRSLDIDESEEEVRGSPGALVWARLHNRSAVEIFVKFYNATAANVTVGTTTPVMTIPMEANSGEVWNPSKGLYFDTAITVAATTGIADNDTGAPAANDVAVNLGHI